MAKTTDFIGQTQIIQKVSALLLAGLAAATALLMSSYAVTETLSYQVRDVIRSEIANQTVFGTAIRNVVELQIKWLLVALLLAGAALALLNATRWRKRYEKGTKDGVQSLRWIEFGVVTALLLEIIALLSGVTDIAVLKLITAIVAVSAVLGWYAERQNKGAKRPVRSAYLLSLTVGLLPWLLIGLYAVATFVYGMVRAPWYVYALYVVGLGSYLLLNKIQWKRFKGDKLWKNNAYVERTYAYAGLVTKLLIAAILIIGLQK